MLMLMPFDEKFSNFILKLTKNVVDIFDDISMVRTPYYIRCIMYILEHSISSTEKSKGYWKSTIIKGG